MTPRELQDLQEDVADAQKLLENEFGRKLSDDETAERFSRLERRLTLKALEGISEGVPWAKTDARYLRAVQRYGQHYGVLVATVAGINLSDLEKEVEAVARDDSRLADEIRNMRVEFAVWDRTKNPSAEGIDAQTICVAFAAGGIRARVELHRRNGDVVPTVH